MSVIEASPFRGHRDVKIKLSWHGIGAGKGHTTPADSTCVLAEANFSWSGFTCYKRLTISSLRQMGHLNMTSTLIVYCLYLTVVCPSFFHLTMPPLRWLTFVKPSCSIIALPSLVVLFPVLQYNNTGVCLVLTRELNFWRKSTTNLM